MVRMIGNADEFWRVRLTRVDTTNHFDFEWHDDILYRAPDVDPGDEVEYFNVEAVRLDDPDQVMRVATFDNADIAKDLVAELKEALAEMSKSQFEAAYLEGAEPGDTGVE
jgi:hypothetical protein